MMLMCVYATGRCVVSDVHVCSLILMCVVGDVDVCIL